MSHIQFAERPSARLGQIDLAATILIRKVKDPHGCWGNMAPYPVLYVGREYRTTEALFQALRFSDEAIREEIRAEKSPMAGKFVAKRNKAQMTVELLSEQDLANMRLCLRLKIERHPELAQALLATGDRLIVEDCTKRQRGTGLFWGAALESGQWKGQNWLGVLWMELRAKLRTNGHRLGESSSPYLMEAA